MKQLLVRFFLFFIYTFIILLAACQKDSPTVINGTITDAKTGQAINGVNLSYSLYLGNGKYGSSAIVTGIDGGFNIELDPDQYFTYIEMTRTGYVPKFWLGASYNKGSVNNLAIGMNPLDAILRLIYINNSAIEKSVYLQAQSKTFLDEYRDLPFIITQPYPFISQPNSKDTLDYPFTSDEQINLYWGFNYFEKATHAPFKDSLNLNRGETATYSITF